MKIARWQQALPAIARTECISELETTTVKSMKTTPVRGTVLLALVALVFSASALGARQFIAIGTGDVTGVPYHGGGAICSLVNAGRADHQIRCTIKSTAGSIENINALRRGERAFGFAQSDLALQAYRGTGAFEEQGEFGGLRVVAALHPETVTLIARDDAGIETAQDLRGKRVNLGRGDSGERATMQSLLNAMGWTRQDFAETAELGVTDQIDALCDGEIDAALLVAGHPNNAVNTTLECGAHLVPISGPAINRMVRNAPYYSATVIPGGIYPGISQEVPTYGVSSLLLSSTNTPRQTVLEVTRAMFSNVNEFRGWHRAFRDLSAERMASGTRVIDVPLHPGAEAFYREAGLLE